MASARYVTLQVLVTLALATAPWVVLSDPPPLQDFCVADLTGTTSLDGFPCKPAASVVDDDFFSGAMISAGDTGNPFGVNSTRATVSAFPGLNTLGLSITRTDLAPGGLNPPHSHPRASELVLVLKGEVMVGFTSGLNRLYSKVVKENELYVVPRGLQHFQLNVGTGDAVFMAMFDAQSPGVIVPTFSLFSTKPAMPMEVLTKTFLMDEDEISALKTKFAPF
ncbi:germin-like protein 1-2 [Brachypodium distachyon]|uniref:Germin-like protein n=1 Tax=Brachypodium distachyon TaxID=15368 RepID=I1HQS2_BRADI|nr:germin-like protein 1-2 [Brachypodium distachyon]KQK09390.1 hypothetical protein BRADI_2g47690v3 [Brachypodium distachyon]|eukprot:XP_003567038.1 germin-like protein 1-2 [Brachypodium distachyon]